MNTAALRVNIEPAVRPGLLDELTLEVRRAVPSVERVLHRYAHLRLHEFLATQIPTPVQGWQPREDFLEVAEQLAAGLFGTPLATRLREELATQATVLTANHHGVDFFAQSVQGSLMFSRRRLPDGSLARTVPVLACGTVPLDNLTYPMGMLIYDGPGLPLQGLPRRLPVLPNRVRRELVSVADPIDHGAPARALDGVRKLLDKHEVSEHGAGVIGDLLAEDYGDPDILALPGYSAQASLINARLWRRLHGEQVESEMVCLELEQVTGQLLQRDLHNPDSLAARLLLHPPARRALLARLDGERACWDLQRLRERLTGGTGGGGGTVLFWGVTDKLRRVPLLVDEDGQGRPVLVGNDDSGGHHCHPFDADSLATALRERRLLPSVFSSFLVLALARGVNCLGGYHQADYLPAMQRGVVAVLRGIQADEIAEAVTAMPTGGYLGGMQALLLERPEGLVPAGVIEMLATGRLDGALLERIDALTVDDAHRASLTDTCVEMLCRDALPADLHAQVAAELRTASGPQPVIARA